MAAATTLRFTGGTGTYPFYVSCSAHHDFVACEPTQPEIIAAARGHVDTAHATDPRKVMVSMELHHLDGMA